MDRMEELRRTCYCGEVTEPGKTVVVGGFVQKVRNLGNLIFMDLRDRTGMYSWHLMTRQHRLFLKRPLPATVNMLSWQRDWLPSVPV